tara:strand:- start:8094 stop:9656 length:1563 start_codon:yes stop_codon:yes gene_type:complete
MSGEFLKVPSNASFFERAANPENTSIDLITSAEDQIRRALKNKFEPDSLSKQIKFYAVCLRKLDNSKDIHDGLVRVKARIPEIHYMLPIPKDKNDMAAIALYPTFVAYENNFNPKIGARTKITPGTILTVTFGNMSNFSEPLLLEIGKILESESPSPSTGGGGGGSTGGRGGPVDLDTSTIDDTGKSFKKTCVAIIRETSKKTGVDPRALAGIMRVESGGFGNTKGKEADFKFTAADKALVLDEKAGVKRTSALYGKNALKSAPRLTKISPTPTASDTTEANAIARAVNCQFFNRSRSKGSIILKNYDEKTLRKIEALPDSTRGKKKRLKFDRSTFTSDHKYDSTDNRRDQKNAHKSGDSFANLFGGKDMTKSALGNVYKIAPMSAIRVTALGLFQTLGGESLLPLNGISKTSNALRESLTITKFDNILAQFYKDPFLGSILCAAQWWSQPSKQGAKNKLNKGFRQPIGSRDVADIYYGIVPYLGGGPDNFNYSLKVLQYGNIFEQEHPDVIEELGFKIN